MIVFLVFSCDSFCYVPQFYSFPFPLKPFQPFISREQLLHEAALAQGELLYQGGLLLYGGVPKGKDRDDALLLGERGDGEVRVSNGLLSKRTYFYSLY